jgi:N-methylhydantoinase A
MSPDGPGVRVGVDVGGTFTKAVALTTRPHALAAQATVPTSHTAAGGVCEGLAAALRSLLDDLGSHRERVEFVAFSTTTAMNALLEGDVGRVGVVGIGAAPDLRRARKRTSVGDIELAPGRTLYTEHAFLDASSGEVSDAAVDQALAALERAGCRSVAVSGAFAVDDARHERQVCLRARARGLPACAGHELSGAYGLETRTVSAAINASILPMVESTASLVQAVLHEAGIDVPLLVLRGDGGAMSVEAFRRAPSMTIGSGPAAGVAAALHQLSLTDAVVLECGGTSSNVSVVKHGRAALRTLRVMGRPTAIRSVDSWVVGAAGGSLARLGGRRLKETGPRSAHVADLPYACFASAAELEGAQVDLIAPREGDPEGYVVAGRDGRRWALTPTCAANALGLVHGDQYAHGSREAAIAGFAALAARMKRTPEGAARTLMDGAIEKIADAVGEAARTHDLGPAVPIVALGGAGSALAPEVARRLDRPLLLPENPEILSSIGAALSLVRAEAHRRSTAAGGAVLLAREAERACVEAGAAPHTVSVETLFEGKTGMLRAIATGAVALESGAATREPAGEKERLAAAAAALDLSPAALELVAGNDFYRVFSENGKGRVAVIDRLGSVSLAADARRVLHGDASSVLDQLGEAVRAGTLSLGVAELVPRVALVFGPRIVDLSDSRQPEEIVQAAREVLADQAGDAVALIWR